MSQSLPNHTRIIHTPSFRHKLVGIGCLLLLGSNLVLLAYLLWPRVSDAKLAPSASSEDVVAVQMTNGQVYYGVIVEDASETLQLKDVFYFKKRTLNIEPQKLQDTNDTISVSAESHDRSSTPSAFVKKQLVLAKLETNLSGKSDLVINKRNVLSWQPLTHSSPVLGAIKSYTENR